MGCLATSECASIRHCTAERCCLTYLRDRAASNMANWRSLVPRCAEWATCASAQDARAIGCATTHATPSQSRDVDGTTTLRHGGCSTPSDASTKKSDALYGTHAT